MRLSENIKTVTRDAISATATFQTAGSTVNMAKYDRVRVSLWLYGSGSGTGAVTLKQAKTAAGGSEKALTFTEYFSNTDHIADDTLVAGTASSNTFNAVAASGKLRVYVVEVKADDLDIDGGFTFFRCDVANVANAIGHLVYDCYAARIAKGADAMPTAIA